MEQIHRDAHADAFERLGKAWSKHFKSPETCGRPIFHKKGRKASFYVANDKLTIIRDKTGSRVRLPVIGEVRMIEDLRFAGRIMGAVVGRHGDRWFISIQVNVPDKKARRQKLKTAKGRVVGVDLGLKTAAVIYDGRSAEKLDSPKPLRKQLKKLRREQRKMARREKSGANRLKTVRAVRKLHATVHDIRKDWLDKLTTKLCRENQAVVIEDLHVKGMLRNHKLARAISDVGFGEFRRQMEYKAVLYKTHLIIVDRWFPSSKTCSRCGAVKESLSLAERVFHCSQCGFEMDRDENAAVNLRKCGLAFTGRAPRKLKASAEANKYPRLTGNQRLGRGRAGSGLVEPGTKPCARLRTS
jgi:putative transposase